jgi:hypothetical protein
MIKTFIRIAGPGSKRKLFSAVGPDRRSARRKALSDALFQWGNHSLLGWWASVCFYQKGLSTTPLNLCAAVVGRSSFDANTPTVLHGLLRVFAFSYGIV